MSNHIVRTIVENIVNDKFDTLKEDLNKAVSEKAVNVLESKKAMVGKKFFEKEEFNEEQIDEISGNLARNYTRKAKESAKKTFWNADPDERDSGETDHTLDKRQKGISVARKKLTGTAKVNATKQ